MLDAKGRARANSRTPAKMAPLPRSSTLKGRADSMQRSLLDAVESAKISGEDARKSLQSIAGAVRSGKTVELSTKQVI